MRPLVILTADHECAATLRGFFERDGFHHSLGCGPIQRNGVAFDPEADILVHRNCDPGIWTDAHTMLLPVCKSYERALVILDHAFDGAPAPENLVVDIENLIVGKAKWERHRFEVILIRPELEAWIWQRNPHVAEAFGFPGSHTELWTLLGSQSLVCDKRTRKHAFSSVDIVSGQEPAWPMEKLKPENPKGVVEALSRLCASGPASGIFNEIAYKVSVTRCVDESYHKFRDALRLWFPVAEAVAAE
jgi:hypothetical protein